MPYLSALRITASAEDDQACMNAGRRDSGGSGDDEEAGSPVFDPTELEHLRRLGEGTGGAVELVKDRRSGRIMAKKVSLLLEICDLD